jgi:hypothetical protein
MIHTPSDGQNTMNKLKAVAAMVLISVVGTACEDITNPIEEFGQLVDPFVRWEVPQSIGAPEQTVGVIIQLPTRLEEDVNYNFALGGDAVFGDDYIVVDREGTPRADVTAAGGSGTITYVEDRDAFSRDTIFFFIPFEAVDGRVIELEIVSAQAASGRNVETGYIERYQKHRLSIEGFIDLPEGTWVGQRTGDFGEAAATVTVSRPADPIEVGGDAFLYQLSDYTGDGGIFGVGVPWAFSATSGGSVLVAQQSHVFGSVTSNVSGSYDLATQTLTLNVELTCCGAEGFGWTLTLTPQ